MQVFIEVKAIGEDYEDCAGLYSIFVNDTIPDDHLANAALDIFHSDVAISSLDDYDFIVTDINGDELEQSEDVESYEYVDEGEVVNFTPASRLQY